MTTKDIENAVLAAVDKQFNLSKRFEYEEHEEGETFDINSIRSFTFVKQLDADALDIIELVMEIEEALRIEIEDDMLEKFFGSREDVIDSILHDHTVQELIDYLNENLS